MDERNIEHCEIGSDMIEKLSALVHKAYCEEYKRQFGEDYDTKGDYNKLDIGVQEFDRATVRAILEELHEAY